MSTKIIGIDLGGTPVRAGVVSEGKLASMATVRIGRWVCVIKSLIFALVIVVITGSWRGVN